jgi:hypothetical protein
LSSDSTVSSSRRIAFPRLGESLRNLSGSFKRGLLTEGASSQ